VWQAPSKDKDGNLEKDFYIAGFRGVELDFSVNISEAEKMILLLARTNHHLNTLPIFKK
jgi:hypothetical protein